MPVTAAQVQAIQTNPAQLRNICILAHVDHGKTTLSDSLLATNGIISTKQSGQIRYLDSRPDEQARGITMKSSAIALHFAVRSAADAPPTEYLVNLIDCPGHVDFTSEVSTASRLCDGALVLVDAVEGVCTQTHTVLHQAWAERIKPVLVINKVDRLVAELKMTPTEAYNHMAKIIQNANAVIGSFYQSELAERDTRAHERRATTDDSPDIPQEEAEEEDDDDEHLYFSPQAGNVVFASAIHGWAFRIQYFAKLYAAKLKLNEATLLRFMWGEYYLEPKTKRILQPSQLKGRDLKPLAVQFMLDNVWRIYEACGLAVTSPSPDPDLAQLEKIAAALKLKLNPRELKKSASPVSIAASLLNQWLPLSATLLVTVIHQIPSPRDSQPVRLPKALPMLAEADESLRNAVFACAADDDAPVVAFLSKLVSVPAASLPRYRPKSLSADELRARRAAILAKRLAAASLDGASEGDHRAVTPEQLADASDAAAAASEPESAPPSGEVMIGMARLYSGRLRRGDTLYVLGPKYDPSLGLDQPHVTRIAVDALYILMGRDVEELGEVGAGNLFGIGGADLERAVLKSATLSSTLACPSLAALESHAAPIVRVAVEPRNPADLPKLVDGLKLLNQSDPAVEVVLQNTGEHVISTSGELHLERCLVDLRERFARCAISVSPPIVPFRETVTLAPPQAQFVSGELPPGTAEVATAKKQCTVRVRAVPLPARVTAALVEMEDEIRGALDADSGTAARDAVIAKIQAAFDTAARENDADDYAAAWRGFDARTVWSLGPKRCGPNLLINAIPSYASRPTWVAPGDLAEFDNPVVTGFQLAAAAGPLCGEPMHGVALIVESISPEWPPADPAATLGQLLTTVRDACRLAFLARSPRLLLATYACTIQCLDDSLGTVYGLVARRRGRILAEEMREGTPYFLVQARVPVVESFGFAEEARKRTSGGASPQLVFAGWDVLDVDPFWVPATEVELEDLGAVADRENVAKRYVDGVRKRKGMMVDEKIVEDGEKQRTLKR
ncbi:Cytoplasmic GTPase/eEF2-like protein (ribosomal biogenesis) [Blastocladiella emersonii ATCC 22665]|nr:Cytoplasmic GTPase/eEF2-like protein (ribosomal biogenesis) [Blastocladiella emersonii ATCC 22665]